MQKIIFFDVMSNDDRMQIAASPLGSHEDTVITEKHTDDDGVVYPDAEIISVFICSPVSRDIMDKMPNLKCIACRSTGFNNVDLAAAKEKGIVVMNVPTYGSHTVAEFAFGLLLNVSRKLPQAIQAADEGNMDRSIQKGFDLCDKTIGIVGAGKIGQNMIQIAKGFSMKVVAFDPFPRPEAAAQLGFEYVSLEDLLAQSDVVSLHVPYTPENHHLLNSERIASMKKGAVLVNTARGELVDNGALIDHLENGHLGGAALDVLEGEQLLDRNEEILLLNTPTANEDSLRQSLEVSILQKLPNVLVTNHNAFNTAEAIARINQTTLDNIQAYQQGNATNLVS